MEHLPSGFLDPISDPNFPAAAAAAASSSSSSSSSSRPRELERSIDEHPNFPENYT